MPNNLRANTITLNSHFITASGGQIYINGTNNLTAISGVAPSTNTLSVPISIDVFGGILNLLGKPVHWVDVNISGVIRKIPCY